MAENNYSSPLQFNCGVLSKNRFMLAPMTNTQSFENGTLSEEEYNWLIMRAKGGFGITMTCAAHVQKRGKGFPGQLGIFSDEHIQGHQKLSKGIKSYGSIAVIQLHHAGMRSPKELIGGVPLSPSSVSKYDSQAMTLEEVLQLKNDFINAAKRAKESGYDGVEIHGAHGYILTQFLSSEYNKRTDIYGGKLENRARLLFEIVRAIRQTCGPQFLLGVRLSPERFGMRLGEIKDICKSLIEAGDIDFLDISLWDVWKMPEEEQHSNKSLLTHFLELDRKNIKLTVAGNIRTGNDVTRVLCKGVDFVSIGKSAILHHNFANQVLRDNHFNPVQNPVSRAYLKQEGLGERFIDYMSRWENFVQTEF